MKLFIKLVFVENVLEMMEENLKSQGLDLAPLLPSSKSSPKLVNGRGIYRLLGEA